MDDIIRDIAANAADYAVGKFGQHLPKGKQLALWQRYYDTAIASIYAYEEIRRARSIRARAFSEN